MEEEIRQVKEEESTPANPNPLVWLILKQLSPEVEVLTSDLDIIYMYITATQFGKYQDFTGHLHFRG